MIERCIHFLEHTGDVDLDPYMLGVSSRWNRKNNIVPDGEFALSNMQVTRGISSLSMACKEERILGWLEVENVSQYFLRKVCHIIPDGESVSLIDWMK